MAARRVDRIHDVVQRPGQAEDVLTVERGHEGAVQPLDDLVGQRVALVLDFLDLVGLVPDRPLGRQHLLEQRRATPDLLRHRHEIVIEPLFARNQSKRHTTSKLRRAILADGPQI